MTNEEAIDVLLEVNRTAKNQPPEFYEALYLAVKALENKPKKGEWISREDMDFLDKNKVKHIHFMCDKCGLVHDFIDGHTAQYNFCPNCGADMREADDGS